jgi:hypothetical protein
MPDEDVTTIHAPAAEARAVVNPVKLSVTMPLAWMVRGYVLAVRRLTAASTRSTGNARDLAIAVFEAINWLDSLADRCKLRGDVKVQALTFARHRTHHQWAAAMYYDSATQDWRWYRVEILPLAENPKHQSQSLEPFYVQHLAERRVFDVFKHIENVVLSVAPDADLS